MIDHLIRFNSEAEAIADPIVGAYHDGEAWLGDVCIPGQRVWKPAEDIEGVDDEGTPTRTPQFLPYWYITISASEPLFELCGHPTCMVVWDRDRSLRIQSKLSKAELSEHAITPTPAGSQYLFGGVP